MRTPCTVEFAAAAQAGEKAAAERSSWLNWRREVIATQSLSRCPAYRHQKQKGVAAGARATPFANLARLLVLDAHQTRHRPQIGQQTACGDRAEPADHGGPGQHLGI